MISLRRLHRPVLFFVCVLLPSAACAATISGTITDASNGKPLVFAIVRLLETGAEVHTDADGRYVFEGIDAGRYTVTVTFAGYADYAIGIVELPMEGHKALDAALQPDVAPLYDRSNAPVVEAAGDEPYVRSLRAGPIRLRDMPIRGYEDYIAIQNGTVRRFYGAPVHVRGARIEEFAYSVDGFSQQDPFTGRSFTAINANTIDDIHFYPGYSDPSNGWLASGHAEVTTRETWATGGSIELVTDNFHGEKSDYTLYAADLSGPLVTHAPGMLTYGLAGEYRTVGNRDPGKPGDWNYLGAWHANLRWRPTDETSTLIGTRGSYEDWKYTPRAWIFNSEHAPRGVDENYSLFGHIEHDFSKRTTLIAAANWLSAGHRQGDGVHFDDLWAYGRPNRPAYSDETDLFVAWDDINLDPDSLANDRYDPLRTPVVESTYTVELPGGETVERSFVVRGDEATVWDDFYKQEGSYLGGALELIHAHTAGAQGRIGFGIQRHTTRMYRHLFPMNVYQGESGGFDDVDRYGFDFLGEPADDGINGAKHPLFLAGHVSERLELWELTVTAGLRWDHFDFDAVGLVDPANPLDPYDRATYADTAANLPDAERDRLRQSANDLEEDELTEIDPLDFVSPRVSARIAVGPELMLHVGAGRFVQRPPFADLYASYDFLEYKVRTGGYSYVFGNPRLDPTTAVLFEAGATQKLRDIATIELSVFTKSYKDIAGPTTQTATPQSYEVLMNVGEATAKGLEVSLRLTPARGVVGLVNYTLSDISNDDLPHGYTQTNIAWTTAQPRKIGRPFAFEQHHRFVAMMELQTGPTDGPMLGETYPLSNAGVTVLCDVGSGFPYDPLGVHNEVRLAPANPVPTGPPGSERTPSTARFDLKANKSLFVKGAELELYLWVINLFDRDNVVDVYGGTGEPDNTGWLDTPGGQQFIDDFSRPHDSSLLTGEEKYMLRQNDPGNFDIRRQIRFGMRVGF